MESEPPLVPDVTAPQQGRPLFPISILADFARDKGGLLCVLQGLLVLGQVYIVLPRAVTGYWWSPAVFMPLYLGYFLIRGPLWRRLYGWSGHVERERSLRTAQSMAWVVPIVLVVFMVDFWPKDLRHGPLSVPVWIACAWTLGMWGSLVVAGRLGIDWLYFIPHHQYFLDVSVRTGLPGPSLTAPFPGWLKFLALFQMVWGFYEHWRFKQAYERAVKEDV